MSNSGQPQAGDNDRSKVAEKLRRFPASVQDDFWAFKSSGDEPAGHRLVLAVLADFAPKRGQSTDAWTDDTALMADIGFDSLAIAETVFFFEDLFDISISNDEIMQVRTVGELRTFVKNKVGTVKA